MNRTNRILSFILSQIMIIVALCSNMNFAYADTKDYANELKEKGFNDSYIASLVKLHRIHPRWQFEVLNTKLDFEQVVENERSYHSKQLIKNDVSSDYLCDCEECFIDGLYLTLPNSNLASASEEAVKHYIDPRNFLNEYEIFQFESQKYSDIETISGVESILKNTFMSNKDITYVDENNEIKEFIVDGKNIKYSAAIMYAAKESKVSAYYLASVIAEVSSNKEDESKLLSGQGENYKNIYNFYNIGGDSLKDRLEWAAYKPSNSITNANCNIRAQAWISKEPSNVLGVVPSNTVVDVLGETGKQSDGRTWYQVKATLGSGEDVIGFIRSDFVDTEDKDDLYSRPWTNPYLSIINGAKYIAKDISNYQFNLYLQKFNVNNISGNMLYGNEYWANVEAAKDEAVSRYNKYLQLDLLDKAKVFYIPQFENMPTEPDVIGSSVSINNLKTEDIRKTSLSYSWDEVPNAVRYEINVKNNTKNKEFSVVKNTNFVKLNNLSYKNNYTIEIIPVLLNDDKEYKGTTATINNTTFYTKNGWNNKLENNYFDYGKGIYSNGWQNIEDNLYYFYPNGVMAKDTQIIDSNGIYYVDSNGTILTNNWANIAGEWRYYGENGNLVLDSEVEYSDGVYYVDKDGYRVTNKWIENENESFYINEYGERATNCFVDGEKDKVYLDNNGNIVKNGWVEYDNEYYYMDENGFLIRNQNVKDNDGVYYVGENGKRCRDKWFSDENGWMYADSNGQMAVNTVAKAPDGLVYLDENGRTSKKRWAKTDKGWVYVDKDGYVITDEFRVKNWRLCYLNNDGVMATNTWVEMSNNLYYFGEDGKIVRNAFIKDDNGTCYVGITGKKVYDKWVKNKDGKHYIDVNGYLVED